MGNCCSQKNAAKDVAKEESQIDANDTNSTTQQANQNVNQESKLPPPQPSPKKEKTPKSTKNNAIGPVLGRPMDDVKAMYTFGKELGRGQFGITHICTHKQTGEQFACKTIAKRKLINKEDVEDVRREVQIMHHLTGQPNIVELKGAFEDKYDVHLVMELCAGGELFDRSGTKQRF